MERLYLSRKKNQSPLFIKLLKAFNIVFQIIYVSLIVAVALVLFIDDEESSCDQPLDLWLEVWACAILVASSLYSLYQGDIFRPSIRKIIYRFFFIPLVLFTFGWIIAGSVGEFKSDTCYDEVYNAWLLTLVILVVNYVFFALICLGIIWLTVCTRGMLADKRRQIDGMDARLLNEEAERLANDMEKFVKECNEARDKENVKVERREQNLNRENSFGL